MLWSSLKLNQLPMLEKLQNCNIWSQAVFHFTNNGCMLVWKKHMPFKIVTWELRLTWNKAKSIAALKNDSVELGIINVYYSFIDIHKDHNTSINPKLSELSVSSFNLGLTDFEFSASFCLFLIFFTLIGPFFFLLSVIGRGFSLSHCWFFFLLLQFTVASRGCNFFTFLPL